MTRTRATLSGVGGPAAMTIELARSRLAQERNGIAGVDDLGGAREHALHELFLIDGGGGLLLDAIEDVELGELLLELALRLEERPVLVEHRRVEPRVLDVDAGHGRDRLQDGFVVGVERAPTLVEHLDDADDRPAVIGQRHAQHRARAETGAPVVGGVEAVVGVDVGDVHRLARRGDPTRDALAGGYADRLQHGAAWTLCHRRLEAAVAGGEEQGRALGVEQLDDFLEQALEEPVEIERGAEDAPELAHHVGLLELDAEALLQIGRRVPSRGLVHSRPRRRRTSSSSPRR